jgi:hypothetical protein
MLTAAPTCCLPIPLDSSTAAIETICYLEEGHEREYLSGELDHIDVVVEDFAKCSFVPISMARTTARASY